MYADDLAAIIRALLCYIEEFQRILTWFGALSGLHCAWGETKASFIPAGPPPPELWPLPWTWEDNSTATPLLGAPMAESIAQEKLETLMVQKLDSRISKYQQIALSFAARILVANSLILGCIWYLLILWAGEASFLKRLQRMVDRFIWKGRNWVARATITLNKAEGGLGQIDIAAQYRALTGSLVIWVTRTGSHPLRSILRDHIGQMSQRRWGTNDLTWIVSPSGRLKTAGSCTWSNICNGWQELKTHIVARRPANIQEWKELPLWRPHVNHRIQSKARCSSQPLRSLRDGGLNRMGDIMRVDGSICSWAEIAMRGIPAHSHAAYRDLLTNLIQVPVLDNSPGLREFFVESTNLPRQQRVWKYMLTAEHCTE